MAFHVAGSGPSISNGAHESHRDKSWELPKSVPQTKTHELDRLEAHVVPQDVAQPTYDRNDYCETIG